MKSKLNIDEVSKFLEVNLHTLRRWDEKGTLKAQRDTPTAHRYYFEDDLSDFLLNNFKYLFRVATKWAFSRKVIDIPSRLYCADAFVFKSRLARLATILQERSDPEGLFTLATSIMGEIGNNSFDHNLGNWSNIPGIFFGYNLKENKAILIDRGQGVLTTLKRVRPTLKNDNEALKVAFTEILSGREPENRGNGLKYVRKIVENNQMYLSFHSGDGLVLIDGKAKDLKIINANTIMKGCLVTLNYKN